MIHLLWILLAAVTWGITNPLLKKTSLESSNDRDDNNNSSSSRSLLSHLYHLMTHWKFCLTQLCNWCGTVFFVKALSESSLTIVVPATNALTFVITELSDSLLFSNKHKSTGKIEHRLRVYVGMALVCVGTALCIHVKRGERYT